MPTRLTFWPRVLTLLSGPPWTAENSLEWQEIFSRMNRIYSNIARIKSSGDVFPIVNFIVSCNFATLKLVEATFLSETQWPKFYNVDCISQTCLGMCITYVFHMTDVKGLVASHVPI